MERQSKATEQLGIPEELAQECGLQRYIEEEQEFTVDSIYNQYSQAIKDNDLETKKRLYAIVSREAENQNGAAVNLLAVLHAAENGTENPMKSVRLVEKAAFLRYGSGCWNIAKMFYIGKYVRKNARQAKFWMSQAVEMEHVEAMKQMACFYEEGDSFLEIKRNLLKAGELYQKLLRMIEKDETSRDYRIILHKSVACMVLANSYCGSAAAAEKTLEPLLRIKGVCTDKAYFLLGRLYAEGNNGKKALEMFWGAGEKGRKEIEKLSYKLADCFDRLSFYEEMAAQGDLYAYKYLGDMYAAGQGCIKNYAKALECYVHAKAGDMKEECEKKIEKMKYMEYCRQLYERAMEAYRTESYELAVVKMEKLAESEKYPDAQVFLAKMMENGHLHCAKNEKKALQYYREAASQNQKEAQRKLVEVYRHGLLGAEKDGETADYWEERLKQ